MMVRIERPQSRRRHAARRRGAQPRAAGARRWWATVGQVARRCTVLLLLATSAWGALQGYTWFTTLPVERVVFTGELRQTHRDRLVEVVQPTLQGGYFGLDLHAIQRVLERELWVYRATVHRVWPLQLRIDIQEQTPIARWGDDALINHRGEKFPVVIPGAGQLPLLSGPAGSERLLIDVYHLLQSRLATIGAQPRSLDRDRLGNWQVLLDGGQKLVLAAENLPGTLDRFLTMYGGLLADRFNDVARIDLRYSNGIAIAWRQQSVAGLAPLDQGDNAP